MYACFVCVCVYVYMYVHVCMCICEGVAPVWQVFVHACAVCVCILCCVYLHLYVLKESKSVCERECACLYVYKLFLTSGALFYSAREVAGVCDSRDGFISILCECVCVLKEEFMWL